MIHADSGNLWVTWIDSTDDVGWVEYDRVSETWSAAAYEPYSPDTVADARGRIGVTVLSN